MGILHDISMGPVRVVFSDRYGGVGTSEFDSANLSLRVGDSESVVAENRQRLAKPLGIDSRWIEVHQVHGSDVFEVSGDVGDEVEGTAEGGSEKTPQADAIVMTAGRRPAAVFTADCVPVVLGSIDPPGVAVVHAGWRGLLSGVVENAVRKLVHQTGVLDWAIAGPSIGPCCYRVETERMREFEQRFGASAVDGPRGSLDLHGAVGAALGAAGLVPPYLVFLGPCTSCSDRLFSFRRDGPVTGRQAVVTWIETV